MAEALAELRQGYAGDLAVAGDTVWVAWAACETDELSLFSEVSRTWPLRPGVGAEAWRRQPPAQFTVAVASLPADGGPVTPPPERVQELARGRSYIQGPVLARGGDQAPWVVWGERRDGGYAIVAWREGRRLAVASAPWPLLQPAAAVDGGGRLWVAWQAWEGRAARGFAVYARCLPSYGSDWGFGDAGTPRHGDTGAGQRISVPGSSSWSPALAPAADGGVWCAWDAWDGAVYRVWLRHAAAEPSRAEDRWDEPLALTAGVGADRGYDLAPSVAVDPLGRAWVAWAHSQRWGRLDHRFWRLRTVHAQVVDPRTATLALPVGYDEAGALPIPIEVIDDPREEEFAVPVAPRLLAGERGVRLVYRRLHTAGYMGFGWDVRALAHTGDGWSGSELLSSGAGFPDTGYGVAEDRRGGLWLAYHACDYGAPVRGGDAPPQPLQRVTHSKHAVANDRLLVERVAPVARPAAPALVRLRPAASSREGVAAARPPEPAATAVERSLAFGSQRYHLLFGDLHRHSLYSKCLSANDGDVLDHWRWALDAGGLDFYALTEHLEYMSYGEWKRTEEMAALMDGNPQLLPLYGFELAIPPGHANFFYVDQEAGEELRVACLSSQHLTQVWEKMDAWLRPGSVLVTRHHQGHRQPDVTQTFAARYEPLIEMVQIRGEYREWVESFLRDGCRMGFVGATDHAYAPAFPFGLTGVWAMEPTRAGVFEALWRRRTFATNGAKMRVFLSAAGHPMGAEGTAAGAPELRVEVEGTARVERVELFRNGRLLHVEPVEARRALVTFRDETAASGPAYYYARVLQERERSEPARPHYGVAYSSPVWLEIA